MSILRIEKLCKSYDLKIVLRDISFELAPSEVVVILGPSGCGKSTLLRCINGLESINSGRILIDDYVIEKGFKSWPSVRKKIGMVFQSYELFSHLNVRQNILLGPMQVQKRDSKEVLEMAKIWLDRVGLLDKLDAYPKELSGGQQQRIAIIRSLCMQPELMLLDEITAALDPEIVREVLDMVLELAKEGMSMLIVTHEMAFARAVADRIIFLDEGKIVEISKPQDFFTSPKSKRAKQFLNLFSYS